MQTRIVKTEMCLDGLYIKSIRILLFNFPGNPVATLQKVKSNDRLVEDCHGDFYLPPNKN